MIVPTGEYPDQTSTGGHARRFKFNLTCLIYGRHSQERDTRAMGGGAQNVAHVHTNDCTAHGAEQRRRIYIGAPQYINIHTSGARESAITRKFAAARFDPAWIGSAESRPKTVSE
jgi:hypothetical protein